MTSTHKLAEQVYAAAARVGWLVTCRWSPKGALGYETGQVSLAQEDHLLGDRIARSTDLLLRYPASIFIGLQKGDLLEIEQQRYQVREVLTVGDGSIKQVKVNTL